MPFVPDQQGQAPTPGFRPDSVTPDSADNAAQGNKTNAQALGNDPHNIAGLRQIQKTLSAQTPEMVRSIAGASSPMQQLPEFAAKPINKLADYLMQKAVGMKKYLPGIGNELADQGIWGTKNMMANQVETKLPQAEQVLQDAVKSVSGTAPAKELADAVSARGNKFILPSGEVPSNMAPELSKVTAASQGLSGLGQKTGGQLSASDLLSLKRQGNWLGYTASGNPASSLEAELGNTQASAAKTALDRLTSGASSDALKTEEALVKANNVLRKPDSLSKPIVFSSLSDIPGSSLGLSTAGQAAQKVAAPLVKTASNPLLINGLFSGHTKSEQ